MKTQTTLKLVSLAVLAWSSQVRAETAVLKFDPPKGKTLIRTTQRVVIFKEQ